MRVGTLTCTHNTPLRELAHEMAQHHDDIVIVINGEDRAWGIVSALDVVAVAASGREQTAGEAAATEGLTISADDRLDRAAQLMTDHGLAHLIVLDPASGRPVGILSALDVAAVYGR
jgi:CBS domain-containing protein